MSEGKFQSVDIGGQVDVVTVGVLVDQDAGVIPSHDYITQDGEGCVVASWGNDAHRAVGWLGRLHIVYIGVNKHVLEFALCRMFQVDTADARVIMGSDIQIPDNHVDSGEFHVQLLGFVCC